LAQYKEDIHVVSFAFAMLKQAFEKLNVISLKKPATDCNENGLDWDIGRKIYELALILKRTFTANSVQIRMKNFGFDKTRIFFVF
jgi:hypothetical protein